MVDMPSKALSNAVATSHVEIECSKSGNQVFHFSLILMKLLAAVLDSAGVT